MFDGFVDEGSFGSVRCSSMEDLVTGMNRNSGKEKVEVVRDDDLLSSKC